MQVLYDTTTRQILAAGSFPTQPSDPNVGLAEITDAQAAKLSERGVKTLALNNQITVFLDPAIVAAEAQKATDATTARNAVLNAAGSAVGVGIGTLTAVQVRGLVACLLFKAGAIDKTGVVQPLANWL